MIQNIQNVLLLYLPLVLVSEKRIIPVLPGSQVASEC